MWVSRATYEQLQEKARERIRECATMNQRVSDLKDQLDEAKSDLARERKRADNSIDELLAVRGIGPVTPPTPQEHPKPRDFFAEDPAEVQRIHERLKADGLMETLLTEVTT